MGLLLHHSVDESAEARPGSEVFRCGEESLSYEELALRSSQLARVLVDSGVKPHDRVAIYMTKSLEMPVAVYGILKAGAAYVPIDPQAPRERVRFILEDCGVSHLVTNKARSRKAKALMDSVAGLRTIVGAEEPGMSGSKVLGWADVEGSPKLAEPVRVIDLDLAYIMYTSGSTGVPKGLMHTHSSGLAYARYSAREYDVRAGDRLGNHSPLHFDMSTFEFLTGPWAGATTVLIPEEAMLFPRSLAELIERERLTFWYSVPLALIQLLDRGGIEALDFSSLRWVLFGGEPFPPKVLARLQELWPHARFSNSYGPAEVNQCTAYHVPTGPLDEGAAIPIGPAWEGADALVIGSGSNEVSRGEVGELLIRSATMMRGYWARPDLNAEAFLDREPFEDFEARYYRTGDLVREDADGNFHFLGRRDRQVKVRGYRVELDEVEGVICALDGVAECAVVALRDDETGETTLAGMALALDGHELDSKELRRGAAARLPTYAVPGGIEVCESLPRTGSGKVDRRAVGELLAAR